MKTEEDVEDEEEEEQEYEEEEEEFEDNEDETQDLDENLAFEFIKKSRGLDAESIDDLLKPKESKNFHLK